MRWRKWMLAYVISICIGRAGAQEIPASMEQEVEATENEEVDDDSFLERLDQYRRRPIDINAVDREGLESLSLLSVFQIERFFSYRNLLGALISVYELQAVPGWSVSLIRRLLPFITVNKMADDWRSRLRKGQHSVLTRFTQTIQRSVGYKETDPAKGYLGGREKLFIRYRYAFKDALSYGVLADKDAGEQLFARNGVHGFDFYSAHLFVQHLGMLHTIAVGDYTVNMGQGLIQWQGLALGGADIAGVKRQAPVLQPYHSAGEYNFHRGLAATIKHRAIETTLFYSQRRLSASMEGEGADEVFHGFQESGYHRTVSELKNRNDVTKRSWGGCIKYRGEKWQISLNAIAHRFSIPMTSSGEPYDLYAIDGDRWWNGSVDYGYTFRNFHFFGETAIDQRKKIAILNAVMVSVSANCDLVLVSREIPAAYRAVDAASLTAGSDPQNERGLYMGMSWRTSAAWRLDASMDVYRFPWLRYQVDAPSWGRSISAQLTYTPNKSLELYSKFRLGNNMGNEERDAGLPLIMQGMKRNWRMNVSYKISRSVTVRQRAEQVWLTDERGVKEEGTLCYFDVIYKPMMRPYSGSARLAYFETSGYGSRLYAYENDVLYGYSIPALFGRGFRYYLNVTVDITKRLTCWFRWAATVLRNQTSIGSGLDEIEGNVRAEWRFQVMLLL